VGDSSAALKATDFHPGAAVSSSDGKEIAELVHVLVDSDFKLAGIVVKESRGFSGRLLSPDSLLVADEFIVPRDAIKSVTRDRVDLTIGSADARKLSPYLSWRRRDETVTEGLEDEAAVLAASPTVPHWVEQVANKPAGELEIDGGENVMLGHTGRKLGTVKDVLFDGDELVGIVLRPEGLFKSDVILPRRFLDRSDDAALFAQIDDQDLGHLEPFKTQP
jgi:sporulation protein YlmC with PRC-barrel domain